MAFLMELIAGRLHSNASITHQPNSTVRLLRLRLHLHLHLNLTSAASVCLEPVPAIPRLAPVIPGADFPGKD